VSVGTLGGRGLITDGQLSRENRRLGADSTLRQADRREAAFFAAFVDAAGTPVSRLAVGPDAITELLAPG
jgi:hypothetical protein